MLLSKGSFHFLVVDELQGIVFVDELTRVIGLLLLAVKGRDLCQLAVGGIVDVAYAVGTLGDRFGQVEEVVGNEVGRVREAGADAFVEVARHVAVQDPVRSLRSE